MNKNAMRKVSVKDLSGLALDWAVAMAIYGHVGNANVALRNWQGTGKPFKPSIDPAQAWPIIDREGIDIHQIKRHPFASYSYSERVAARYPDGEIWTTPNGVRFVRVPVKPGPNTGKWLARMSVDHHMFGWKPEDFMSDTSLIAAMRCWVGSKFGEYIEVPAELLAA